MLPPTELSVIASVSVRRFNQIVDISRGRTNVCRRQKFTTRIVCSTNSMRYVIVIIIVIVATTVIAAIVTASDTNQITQSDMRPPST